MSFVEQRIRNILTKNQIDFEENKFVHDELINESSLLEMPSERIVLANRVEAALEHVKADLEKAEAEQNIAPAKRQRIWIWLKAFIKESYRLAMRSFFDSAMHK